MMLFDLSKRGNTDQTPVCEGGALHMLGQAELDPWCRGHQWRMEVQTADDSVVDPLHWESVLEDSLVAVDFILFSTIINGKKQTFDINQADALRMQILDEVSISELRMSFCLLCFWT